MSHLRAFCPNVEHEHVTLGDNEHHHLRNVRRVTTGQTVVLFDGSGKTATAVIERIGRKETVLRVARVDFHERNEVGPIAIATALPRQHRQQFLVEKCTELGVSEVLPLETNRCTVKGGPGLVERFQRWSIEAAKQSGRVWLPKIHEPISFERAVSNMGTGPSEKPDTQPKADPTREAVATNAPLDTASAPRAKSAERHDRRPAIAATIMADIDAPPVIQWWRDRAVMGGVCVLIGPEGGWSPDELSLAANAGIERVSLARTTLRIETAAIAAVAYLAANGLGEC